MGGGAVSQIQSDVLLQYLARGKIVQFFQTFFLENLKVGEAVLSFCFGPKVESKKVERTFVAADEDDVEDEHDDGIDV